MKNLCLKISFIFIICLCGAQSSKPEVQTSDCNKEYSCFRYPPNCQNLNCDYLVKWKKENDGVEFLVSSTRGGLQENKNFYLAIGFSYDQTMNNDSVVMCKFQSYLETPVYNIQTYFNENKNSSLVDKSNRAIGLSNLTIRFQDDHVICGFSRMNKPAMVDKESYFDLNKPYYLLVAKGHLSDDGEPMHHVDKLVSANLIYFLKLNNPEMTATLIKVHAILMLVAWIILSSVGILFARYYKYIFPKTHLFELQFWFVVHRALMMLSALISIVALFVMLYAKHGEWIRPEDKINFSHSILGIVTIFFAFIQPMIAFFRPERDEPTRPVFNWMHRLIGILTYILAMCAIILGTIIFTKNLYWVVVFAWIVWIVIVVVFLEFMDFKSAWFKKENESDENNKMGTVENTKINFNLNLNEKFKSGFMALHILVALAFTISFILFILFEMH